MSAEGPLARNGDTGATTEEVELAEVLESYLAHLEAGGPADPEGLIAAHPKLARPLRACLKVMHLAQGLDESGQLPTGARVVDCDTFGAVPPSGSSALTALWPGDARPPRVLLPEPADDDSPIVLTHSDAQLATPGGAAERYRILGEIARGGMGVVFKARDAELGRDLALKVLLDRHRGNEDVVRRFVEEAQIGGQLQHPGIVPVHELGTLADLRPFFAMTLVKGRTLAALLAEREDRAGRGAPDLALQTRDVGRGSPDPALQTTAGLPSRHDDLPRFLGIFEAVCQTVAYAHARRVIHRDLKPANVMVGNFGEVQVMDWGLAKVLAEGGIADEAKAIRIAAETAILTVRSGPTGSGSESQAGSVLGTPAYMAPEQARGDVERIDERADVFGLGAILCEILTGLPPYVGSTREEIRDMAARGDLADALDHLPACGADTELVGLARDCLAAQREQRPRNAGEVARRVTVYQASVQERLKVAELARVEAQARAEEAQARAAIERSRRLRTMALAASVLVIAGLVGGGGAYLTRLRLERSQRFNRALSQAEFLYDESRRAGDDPARWLAARGAAHALEDLLADAPDQPTRRRATALVRDVTLAAAAAESDQKLLSTLADVRSARVDDPDGSVTDASYRDVFRDAGIEIAVLRSAEAAAKIRARPADVRIAMAAAINCWAAVRSSLHSDQAGARWLIQAARLADPDPWRNRLRDSLEASSSQERLSHLKNLAKSARINELPAASIHLLGETLLGLGDSRGAEVVLREGLRQYPGDVWLNYTLAQGLERQTRREEAIRYYMAARSLGPNTAHALAHALAQRGETDQAIAVFQDLVRLRPNDAAHLACLGATLKNRGRSQEANAVLEAAIAACRTAIVLKPDSPHAHNELGSILEKQDKLSEAIIEYREALRLKPDLPHAHRNLGNVLRMQGNLDEAIAEYRAALRLKLDDARSHLFLGIALKEHGKLEEAVGELREAVRINRDSPEAHNSLGVALSAEGKREEAIAAYREALRLEPDYPEAHNNLGSALGDQGKLDEAIAEYRAALRIKPNLPETLANLGLDLAAQGKLDEATTAYREALRLKPDFPEAHQILGAALGEQGRLDEAITELREALRLKPNDPLTHSSLGAAFANKGNVDAAIAEYREALRITPDRPEPHANLGIAFRSRGEFAEAMAELRKAHTLAQRNPSLAQRIERELTATACKASLVARLPVILAGKAKPSGVVETLGFAQLCYDKKLHGASARLWSEAFQAQPKLVDDMQAQNRYNAACAAALAGSGQGKDDPAFDDAAKTRWRKQAMDWLKADLAAWSKILDSGPPKARQAIAQTLQHWKTDTDLAGLREPAALAKLTADEQTTCRNLWAAVDALLAKSQGTNHGPGGVGNR